MEKLFIPLGADHCMVDHITKATDTAIKYTRILHSYLDLIVIDLVNWSRNSKMIIQWELTSTQRLYNNPTTSCNTTSLMTGTTKPP